MKYLLITGFLCCTACASLSNYLSPTIEADRTALDAAVVVANADLLQMGKDVSNIPALVLDGQKFLLDKNIVTVDYNKLSADLKAAGQVAPVTPTVLQ